jgi:thymidine phosphorylase
MHAEDARPRLHDQLRAPTTRPTPSTLALRRVAIDTWHENVAYLHRDCAVYRAEGFQALSKVEVRANGRHILATVNVVDDAAIVGCHELGLSEDAFAAAGRAGRAHGLDLAGRAAGLDGHAVPQDRR